MAAETDAPDDLEHMIDLSIGRFQERTPQDVAAKVRFFYEQLQYRVQVRDRAVASLLEDECQMGTRLREVVRAYGWFNEVGEKERVQLYQELRDLEKQRRRLYDESFKDIHGIKSELVEALIEYRALRRRDEGLEQAGTSSAAAHLPTLESNLVTKPSVPEQKYSLSGEYRVV